MQFAQARSHPRGIRGSLRQGRHRHSSACRLKRSDATAALSWANDTRATSDTRITATEFRVLCVIAGGCRTRAEIAAAAGCSQSTVPRAVRRLEKIKALKREQHAGKANDYVVQVRSDTGATADTGITTGRAKADTRISKAVEQADTGAEADTGSAVDNSAPLIRNASARVENKSSSIELELYSERVESSSSSARDVVILLNGSAAGMPSVELARILVEQANHRYLDPSKQSELNSSHPRIKAWMRAGADFDDDIMPAVLALVGRAKKPIRTWEYFTEAVREKTAQRLAAEIDIEIITPAEANHDQQRIGRADTGASYGRAKRNHHTDLLLRDVLDDSPSSVGGLDFSPVK